MVKISAVILTLNEERSIERCILSVKNIVDEILIVDSFSSDTTAQKCISLGVRFIQHKFDGYIEQKNWAMGQAENDYILSLDADETLSPELKQSILQIKNNWCADGYMFHRVTSYCGKWIRHGGWYPDSKIRLWDRNKGQWGGINPHDTVVMNKNSKVLKIKQDILHYSFETVFDFFQQSERFSTIAALAMFEKNKKINSLMIIVKPIWKFIKDYFIKMGFLDGYQGFVVARVNAMATFSKYIKLQFLNKKNK